MRSPEGENETSCTQPPLGLENSPQTVLNGNFSPQTVGSGLTQISAALTPHPHAGKYSLGIDALDKRGKHARPGVGRARGEQDVVGVPVDREHGRSKRLFEVLRSPPVVFFVKGADGDGSEGRGFSGDSEYGIYRAAERCFRGMDDVANLFGGTEQARIRSSAILAPLGRFFPHGQRRFSLRTRLCSKTVRSEGVDSRSPRSPRLLRSDSSLVRFAPRSGLTSRHSRRQTYPPSDST